MNLLQNHLLVKYGILKSFSIAKTISGKKIQELKKRLGVTDDLKLREILKKEIVQDTQKAIYNDKIPGIVFNKVEEKITDIPKNTPQKKKEPQAKNFVSDKKRVGLSFFSTMIIQKLLEQKLSKNDCCFFIFQLVTALGLKDIDFKKFHGVNIEEEDDDDDEDDED